MSGQVISPLTHRDVATTALNYIPEKAINTVEYTQVWHLIPKRYAITSTISHLTRHHQPLTMSLIIFSQIAPNQADSTNGQFYRGVVNIHRLNGRANNAPVSNVYFTMHQHNPADPSYQAARIIITGGPHLNDKRAATFPMPLVTIVPVLHNVITSTLTRMRNNSTQT